MWLVALTGKCFHLHVISNYMREEGGERKIQKCTIATNIENFFFYKSAVSFVFVQGDVFMPELDHSSV